MNYIPYQLPALCTACGARIADEPEDPTGYACDDCFCESERKAHEENLRDFRWCARGMQADHEQRQRHRLSQ